MGLFSKEKDVFLKIVNAVLIVGFVVSMVITLATGIKIINKEEVLSYDQYAKKVCAIDKLEYECTDDECIKELDKERKKTCNNFYIADKKEKEEMNKTNVENFFISLTTSIVLLITVHVLNKKI